MAETLEEEKAFLEGIPANANLSNNFDDIINYAFFHFTPAKNLKIGRDGTPGKGIENNGIEAAIGNNSAGYEDKQRAYYSIGASGAIGLANRLIFLSMVRVAESDGLSLEQAKQIAFGQVRDILSNSVYLKMNLEDGIHYDSNDFMTRRNSHKIENVNIPRERLEVFSVNGSTNGLDILEFLYANCNHEAFRRGGYKTNTRVYEEENYISEFIQYIREHDKESKPKHITTLKVIDLAERKRVSDISNVLGINLETKSPKAESMPDINDTEIGKE